MATSVLMAADTDRQPTTPSGGHLPFPQHHAQDHDHHHHPIRRSSGRRKSKGSESSSSAAAAAAQKKKQPQRGMGVEKLERLRLQDRWKKMTEINHHPFNNPVVAADPTNLMNINAFISSPPHVDELSKLQMNQNHTSYLGFHGVGGGFSNECLNHSDFLGKITVGGFSKELSSSTPNSVNCFSQHCNACHKKKKVNGENLGSETHKQMCNVGNCRFLGLNIRDNQNTINKKNQGYAAVGKGVEVVAVHRRGSSSSEGGGVVMEYEFFPSSSGKACDSDQNDDELVMMKQTTSSSSSMGGFDASNCIDLSLKLSY